MHQCANLGLLIEVHFQLFIFSNSHFIGRNLIVLLSYPMLSVMQDYNSLLTTHAKSMLICMFDVNVKHKYLNKLSFYLL